jgi:hypothetical protein
MVNWSAMWGAVTGHWPWTLIGALLLAVLLVGSRFRRKLEFGHWLGTGVVLAVALCVWAILWIPAQQSKSFLEQNEARRTVVQICGGLFAIAAIVQAIIRVRQNARDLAIKESEERTGRYLRSAELLGSVRQGEGGSPAPNIESRLGAIYSLGRLAIDSVEDYWAVAEVLASYVRINAATKPLLPGSGSSGDIEADKIRVDVQTAVELLARASPHDRVKRPRMNLRDARLNELRLEKADLCEADLSGAKLRHANLLGASLVKAVLRGTDLRGATLRDVGLQGADLEGAELSKADLSTAQFDRHTTFDGADLGSAKFYEASCKTEEARGLSPDKILLSREWMSASFSPSFHDKLMALASAPTGGEESGASGTTQVALC